MEVMGSQEELQTQRGFIWWEDHQSWHQRIGLRPSSSAPWCVLWDQPLPATKLQDLYTGKCDFSSVKLWGMMYLFDGAVP